LQVVSVFYKLYRAGTGEESKERAAELLSGLHILEKELTERGTTFFNGNSVGTIDYYIWPWFERMFVIEEYYKKVIFNWKQNYPKLVRFESKSFMC